MPIAAWLFASALALMSATLHAQTLRIRGSSAGHAIVQAALDELHKAKKTSGPVIAGVAGSAGALKTLCRGEIDIANTSRPIVRAELELCAGRGIEFVEVPLAFDAVTVVVNPRNTFVTSLTLDELKQIWERPAQAKVTRWNRVDARFPDGALKLYGPDSRSEGSNYFFEAVLGAAQPPRRDYTASVDDNVLVQGVARDAQALSFMPLAVYLEHRGRIKAVPVAAPGGKPVLPSAQTIARGEYRPLSRPLFLYASVKSLERPEVREFAEYLLANSARLARDARYVALGEPTYRSGVERVRGRTPGTAWGGVVPVGLTAGQLAQRGVR